MPLGSRDRAKNVLFLEQLGFVHFKGEIVRRLVTLPQKAIITSNLIDFISEMVSIL
jgi:hypothetical protein